jgi:hypothetical protein
VFTDEVILIDPSRDEIYDQMSDFKAIFDIEVQGNLQEVRQLNSYDITTPNSINFRRLVIGRTRLKSNHKDKRAIINAKPQNHGRHLCTGIHLSMAISLCHWKVELPGKSTCPDIS